MTGSITGDPLSFARFAMRVYTEAELMRDEGGWPSMSSEARAAEQARTATLADRRKYPTRYTSEGTPRPEACPKQTRSKAGSRAPLLPPGRALATAVSHALFDMPPTEAKVLKIDFLRPDAGGREKAQALGLTKSAYFEARLHGLYWLAGRLSAARERS